VKLFRRPSRLPLWREEVSFRSADERYVSRRQLGKFMALTSLGMLAGNVWILVRSSWRRAPRHPAEVVARAGDLAVGGARVFEYAGEPRLLVRLDENRYAAYSQKCTHLSCAVHYEHESGRLACPCHVGYFSAATGAVLQGPPPRPLPRVVLERRGDDLVAVGIEGEQEA
jgi:arsenite oxidase small subunit